jgi:Protein of unknown function with HXXEE motif
MLHVNFGLAWVAFALTIALHAVDEAAHDFLGVYNPNALAIRRRTGLPIPVVTLRGFIATLGAAVVLMLLLAPLAFHGVHWIRVAAIPVAILAGVANGAQHIGTSIFLRRQLPGVITSPLCIFAGTWLLWSCCR